MAALSAINPTLLDFSRMLDPNGKVDKIVELLAQTNEIIEDMVWQEGNLLTGHKTTVMTGLPTPTWRKLYGGVQPTKMTTAQVTESCGMLEDYSEVDKALADLGGNASALRAKQARGKLLGMSSEFAATLFNGNETTEPEAFTGFVPRFDSTSAANAENLINGGAANGQTDCTSVWIVAWGENTAFGIFPQGSKAGWQHTDKGQVTAENIDGSNGRAEIYRDHFRWDCGLCVADWRYVVRIHSIDVSTLTKNAASGADLIDLIAQGLEMLPNTMGVNVRIYCNRTIKSYLRRQVANKVVNSTLAMSEVAGKHVLTFDGFPVRRCDAITSGETSKN